MIPYFEQPTLSLGPITIHAFGALVATAVWVGYKVFNKRLLLAGLDPHVGERFFMWSILGGFLGAHLVHCFVYFPAKTLADPITILKFWEGLSSFGGFLGAITGATIFLRRMKLGADSTWRFVDAVSYSSPFGWIFGRTGCFVAFDHPGAPTTFFLGQYNPQYGSQPIHNLGLEEALFTIVLAGLFVFLGKKPRFPGFYFGLLFVLYAPVRFGFDFLRVVDVRYGGLTPGQWGSIAAFAFGLSILVYTKKRAALADAMMAPLDAPAVKS